MLYGFFTFVNFALCNIVIFCNICNICNISKCEIDKSAASFFVEFYFITKNPYTFFSNYFFLCICKNSVLILFDEQSHKIPSVK